MLSLMNRLIAVTKPVFHRTKVTPRLVVCWSLILNLSLVLLVNWVYVFGIEPIRCAYQEHHLLTLVGTWFILFFLCIFLAASIYLIVSSPSPAAAKKQLDNKLAIAVLNNNSPAVDDGDKIFNNSQPIVIQEVKDALALIELKESARKFVTSLLPLFLLPLVAMITSLPACVCLELFPSAADGESSNNTCTFPILVASYDDKLFSLQALISPLMTIWKDTEIHAPLIDWLEKYVSFYSTIIQLHLNPCLIRTM